MNEQNSERAPRLAAAMRDVRQVQAGHGQTAERIRQGRLAGGRRHVDDIDEQNAVENDDETGLTAD